MSSKMAIEPSAPPPLYLRQVIIHPESSKNIPEFAACGERRRKSDSVVESETERLVDVLAALAVVEQILLKVVTDREELAARGVSRRVNAVRASDTTRQSTCNQRLVSAQLYLCDKDK